MSQAVLKEIVERAVEDENFRKELLKNPGKAMKGYDLTKEERKLLKDLNEGTFDQFAGGLGARSTKGWLPGGS